MEGVENCIYSFEGFRIDPVKRQLLGENGEPLSLTSKAFDTLLFLVSNRGRIVEKDELMSAVWTDTIVEENNLSQNISALRRVLGETRNDHRFIVTVPGKGFRFVAEVHESPLRREERNGQALSIEKSPIHTTADAATESRSESGLDQLLLGLSTRRWLLGLGGVTFLILVSLGFYAWRESNIPNRPPVQSLAVLPFKPVVANERDESLEVGIADTLISKLGGEQLVVRPIGAVRRFDSIDEDPVAAGRELGVEAVLDGTIQIAGDRIRISARLTRIADGRQLWSGRFDENLTHIFDVQDSISERVASVINARLTKQRSKRYTDNPEAYRLYLLGKHYVRRTTPSDSAKAIECFEKAIQLDPNYALAQTGIGQAHRLRMLANDEPPSETMPKVRTAALKALEIDPELSDAYISLATVAFYYDWDWNSAEELLKKADDLDSGVAELSNFQAHFYSNMGRHDVAIAQARKARELEPLSVNRNFMEGQFLFYARRYDESIDRLNKSVELDPNHWLPRLFMARVYLEKGMYREAIAEATKAKELGGVNFEIPALIGCAYARMGENRKARALLAELENVSTQKYVPPYFLALIHIALGEKSEALRLLEKSFEVRDVRMTWLRVDPKLDDLRNEPLFRNLMKRMNFEA